MDKLSERLRRMSPEKREFTLSSLAYHLSESRKVNRLNTLLTTSPTWMDEKFRAFGTDEPFLSDLQLAIDLNTELLPVIQLHIARHVVRARVEAYTDTDLETLVWLGEADRAKLNARLRSDVAAQVDGLIRVYRALKDNGSSDVGLLGEIWQIAQGIKDKVERVKRVCAVAEEFAVVGDVSKANQILSDAIATIISISEADVKTTIIGVSASTIIAAGHFSDEGELLNADLAKQEVVWKIEKADERTEMLRAIGEVQVRAGLFEQAQATLDMIRNKFPNRAMVHVDFLCAIAKILLDRNDKENTETVLSEAYQTIFKISDESHRAYYFSSIVSLLEEVGRHKEAKEALTQIHELVSKIEVAALEIVALLPSFQIGRSQGRDRVNVITYVQNLCQIAEVLTKAKYKAEAERTVTAAQNIVKDFPERSAEMDLLGESPCQYIQREIEGRVVHIEALYGRRIDALRAIAEVLSLMGRFDEAQVIVAEFHREHIKVAALHTIARELIRVKQFSEAHQLATEMKPGSLFETSNGPRLIEVTLYMASAVDFVRSRFNTQTHTLYLIVEALSQAARFDEAREIIATTESKYAQAEMQKALAKCLACSGRKLEAKDAFNQAQETAATSLDPEASGNSPTTSALVVMADKMAQVGAFEIAKKIASKVTNSGMRMEALRAIAEALAKTGQEAEVDRLFTEAQKSVFAEPDPYMKATRLHIIAKAQARTGRLRAAGENLQKAMVVILKMDNPGLKADALRFWAEASVEVGIEEAADVAYQASLQFTHEIFPLFAGIPLLTMIAESLSKTGREEAADQVFEKLKYMLAGRYPRAHASDALSTIEALARTGRFDFAISLAATVGDDIRYPEYQPRALSFIAIELAKVGRYLETTNLVMALTNHYYVTMGLSQIAAIMFKNGATDLAETTLSLARKAVDKIMEVGNQVDAMAEIASALAQMGRFDEAKTVAMTIANHDVQTRTLNEIAILQIQAGRFMAGFHNLSISSLDHLITYIAQWSDAFEQVESGLTIAILSQSARIVGWRRSDWQQIYWLTTGRI